MNLQLATKEVQLKVHNVSRFVPIIGQKYQLSPDELAPEYAKLLLEEYLSVVFANTFAEATEDRILLKSNLREVIEKLMSTVSTYVKEN